MSPDQTLSRTVTIELCAVSAHEAHDAIGAIVDMFAGGIGATTDQLDLLDIAVEELAEVLSDREIVAIVAVGERHLKITVPTNCFDRLGPDAVAVADCFTTVECDSAETALVWPVEESDSSR